MLKIMGSGSEVFPLPPRQASGLGAMLLDAGDFSPISGGGTYSNYFRMGRENFLGCNVYMIRLLDFYIFLLKNSSFDKICVEFLNKIQKALSIKEY